VRLRQNKLNLSGEVETEDSEGTWAISYGDLVTLLLSFFVIFFTTDPQKEKAEKMTNLLGFEIEGLHSTLKEEKISTQQNTDSINYSEWKDLNIKVVPVGDSLIVTFGAVSFFDSGKTELKESSKEVLRRFTEKYLPFAGNYVLSVRGLTDKKPVTQGRHRYSDNLELSALRSISAMRFLRSLGVPFKRMEIAGMGELQAMSSVMPTEASLSPEQIEAISRTVVLAIKPDLGVIK
jgi:chemotaxis protein MotB